MNNTKKALDFKSLYMLCNDLIIQVNKLEGKNGLLQKAFANWQEVSMKSLSGTREYSNTLLNQERDEELLKKQDNNNSLRFFKPYYDEYCNQIAKGNIPNFLKTKNIGLKLDMAGLHTNNEKAKKVKSKYENFSEKQKIQEEAKILKALAIVYARQANILNRFKESGTDFKDLMNRKHIAMENFMLNAIRYNKLVSPREQIAFGISNDKTPVLDASLPGFTRLSLHFGGERTCTTILNNVNKLLRNNNIEKYFPTSQDRRIDLKKVYETKGYSLPQFGIINTGIINSIDYDNSEIYQKHMKLNDAKNKNLMSKRKVEAFINFMYSDLNDREVFYLAEKTGFGKEDLETLNGLLIERANRIKTANRNGNSIEKQYLIETVNEECFSPEEKSKRINELYKYYMETAELKDGIELENFKKLLINSGIDKGSIDGFIKINKKEQNEKLLKNIDNLEFDEILKLSMEGCNIPQDVFSQKFAEQEEMDILYEQSKEKYTPPILNEKYFKEIFRKGDFKTKILLLFRTVETRFANQPKLKDEEAINEYSQKLIKDQEKLEELILDELILDEGLKQHEDQLIEIITDASELIEITNNDPDDTDKQGKIVGALWNSYKTCLSQNEENEKISEDDKDRFKSILDSFWVDEEIANGFENLPSQTYYNMMQSVEQQNVYKRNSIENMEQKLLQEKGQER